MKRKIDFIFDEEKDSRKIFRFYPRSSHVHGFGDECPKSWDEVYKVYYSWAVIHQFKWDEDKDDWESNVVFRGEWDEESVIGSIPNVLHKLPEGDTADFCALGDGVDWTIIHHKERKICDGRYTIKPCYELFAWKHYTNQGYKFYLSYEEAERFSKYIDYVQEYMLAHSEPI